MLLASWRVCHMCQAKNYIAGKVRIAAAQFRPMSAQTGPCLAGILINIGLTQLFVYTSWTLGHVLAVHKVSARRATI